MLLQQYWPWGRAPESHLATKGLLSRTKGPSLVTAPDGSPVFEQRLSLDPGTFTLAEGGTYTIMVGSDSDAGSGAYEFTLTNVP